MTEFCEDPNSPSLSSLGLCTDSDAPLPGGTRGPIHKYGDTVYHSIQVGYAMPIWNAEFTFGVINVLDKQPPISYSAFANSAPATLYETWGSRQPYLKVDISF